MANPTQAELVDRRSKCGMRLDWFQTKLEIRADQWVSAAKTMGSCYSKAYNLHLDAINAQAKYDKLQSDLCFAVLGAVVVGGLGSMLSTYAKESIKKAPELIAEGVEDTLQGLLGNMINIGSGQIKFESKTAKLPPPLELQNDLETRIINAGVIVKTYINNVREKIINAPVDKFVKFNDADMKKQLEQYLAGLDKKKAFSATNLPPVYNSDELAAAIETGFWAVWVIQNLKYKREITPWGGGGVSVVIDDYKKPGKEIEKRLNALGITQAAGIGADFGWITDVAELAKLCNWCEKYKPIRKFGL